MKNIAFIPLFILIVFICQLFLPWWIIVIISFLVCYILKIDKFISFAGCFVSVFLLWILKAYIADNNFDVPMSVLLSGLMGNISKGAVFFLTGVIGGLISGLGGLLGAWTRQISQ